MRVLLIGLGSIARKHIEVLQQFDAGCHLQVLRSGTGQSSVDDTIHTIYSFDEIREPDFIIISNPTALHRETIEKIVRFKCPLFVEKPLFNKIEKKEEELVRMLDQERFKTYVACNMRFHPVIKFLKDFLAKDPAKVNEVNVYCGSYLPDWRPGTDFRLGYSANPAMGGGVHLDLIHEMDYVYYLFGAPGAVKSVHTNRSSLNIPAVDSSRYLMDYGNFSVSLSLNYFRKETKRTVEVVRENDILLGDLLKATVTDNLTNSVIFKAPDYSVKDTYREQMEYFIENRTGVLMNSATEAFNVLKLALS